MGYTVGGAFLCIACLLGVYVWVVLQAVADWIRRSKPNPAPSASSRPEPPENTAPKYHAHAIDGTIIGTFDTVLDAEICGLTAAGVKAVDLPLVLHERRRLGTFGSFRDPEPARADQPKRRTAAPARPAGRAADASPSPTWGERIGKASDLRKAYPAKRLSDCREPRR
jgi:hypothetical protein